MSRPLDELTDRVAQVSEIYTTRFGIKSDGDWLLFKLQEELGELTAEHLRLTGRKKREGRDDAAIVSARDDEAADLLAMLLLYAQHHNIDLEAALDRKWLHHLRASPETR